MSNHINGNSYQFSHESDPQTDLDMLHPSFFVKRMMQTEYHVIGQRKTTEEDIKKPKVLRKKTISIEVTNNECC